MAETILIPPRVGLPPARISISHDGDRKGKLFLQMLDFAEKRFDSRLRIAVMTLDDISRYVVGPCRGDFFSVGHSG
ncbi:conserved hypothetical protein [Agrobacterium tumefaciens str. B6]|uniref:Uncharacterized protein n=2 Tax=Agrobacterium tumefaciens TaxID=358 RepID=A0A822V5L0_AGRTU|nr:conserved hypothetical protein [Agrobacterium tumefaciens str. Kerr 14]CVI19968.1 conserved hypothetical protein [Agrobacterium tumefaciens str. B6]